MFGIENYGAFILAVLIFQLIPGAGTVAILSATARYGYAAGMRAVLGTLVGDAVFMSAAVLGLAAVMNANPIIFRALQWIGAAYLCWLGIKLLVVHSADSEHEVAQTDHWSHARRGFAVSLTNPKVMLFFVSFFPQFLRPDSSSVTLVVLMAHVTVISLLYQSVLVTVGNRLAQRLNRAPVVGRLAKRLAGVALISFGVRLAANNR